ncbi:MAG: hypothetical protein A2506_03115 [Elusimicrobia bacterium RIFOXYD12_FULL_66_9]|nr:MAG: hypothetical protein A2506_03115 [Elusimicrobia bacterium RIFOXYD12_FULL_66_9]
MLKKLKAGGITYVAIGALIFLVSMGGMVHYSESPGFCNSCHIMGPYFQAWKASKHNKVSCVECHYPPSGAKTLLWKKFQASTQVVKYITRTYSPKPFAEVEDAACLRSGCHSERLLDGWVVDKAKHIRFNHTSHLSRDNEGRQLRCVSCHGQVMLNNHIEVNFKTCFLCHFKGRTSDRDIKPLKGCLGCHEIPPQNFKLGNMTYNHKEFVTQRGVACTDCHLNTVQGTGNAPKERCVDCHNTHEKLEQYTDVTALHKSHVAGHSIGCFRCHNELSHGFAARADAEALHIRKSTSSIFSVSAPPHQDLASPFVCANCHQDKHMGQEEMYTGLAQSMGLPVMPSPMHTARVACIGCHYDDGKTRTSPDREFKGINFRPAHAACVKCHGKKFEGLWDSVKQGLAADLGKLDVKLQEARAGLKGSTLAGKDLDAAKAALEKAARLQRFVRDAHGEHNIYLASKALRESDKIMTGVGEKAKTSLVDVSDLPMISGSYCAMCHEKVGVKVPPETVQPPKVLRPDGKIMPHKMHAEMMGCVNCHEIGAHKKVPLRKGVESKCQECHPK